MDTCESHKEKKRPQWAQKLIEESKNLSPPTECIRERKRPSIFSNYVALMNELSNSKLSNVEEAMKKSNWLNAMIEEYNSIL